MGKGLQPLDASELKKEHKAEGLKNRRFLGCAMAQPRKQQAFRRPRDRAALQFFCNNDVNVRLTSVW